MPRINPFWYWAQHHSTSQPAGNLGFTLSQGRLKAPVMCEPSAWDIVMDYIIRVFFFFYSPNKLCFSSMEKRVEGNRIQVNREGLVRLTRNSPSSFPGPGGGHRSGSEVPRWSSHATRRGSSLLGAVDFRKDLLMKKNELKAVEARSHSTADFWRL